MLDRRQFFSVAAVALGLAPLAAWVSRPGSLPADNESTAAFPVARTAEEWRASLTAEQFRVLRGHGTERPFSSPLNEEKRHGTFVCAACRHPLFASSAKYESGTGWPSFWAPLDGATGTSVDRSFFMLRTEVHCANCGGHLGHVFPDGPAPTGLRYCMNGVAMAFEPAA